ncbi:hypothetical protein M758_UG169200 [Ceratodon purpureus]|nr:hypothetical protein M758_UG169200 [Ceratodon purpureus]
MAARTVATATLEARLDVATLDRVNPDSSRENLMKSFRKREEEHMTDVEAKLLKGLSRKGIFELFFLYHPPFFYENREACGEEVHAGHVSKWTTFIIVETLLAALAIQPLVANVSLVGWRLSVYGLLWMLTLLGSFIGLVVNAALLGHLLHCPHKLAWIWLCKVGYVSEFPRLFMWISSVMSLLAIGYTTWTLYGAKVGIPCVIVELSGLLFTKWLMWRLKKSLEETYETK